MAETRKSVSAVISAYFEEKTIATVIDKCLFYVDDVIVVNDGSTDDTSNEAKKAGARVIELEQNMGVKAAIKRGFYEATGDILVTLDADGQHDPAEIPKLIQPILDNKADLVMGVRQSFPHLSEKILTWLTNFRVPCTDASTGFRAIRREIAQKMKLKGTCLCGTFVLEAAHLGANVIDVPISILPRNGPRRIQTRHIIQFFYVLWDVVRFW